MKSARHQLILIGFFCQGLVWDSMIHWLIGATMWILALGPLRRKITGTPLLEFFALLAGSLASYAAAKALGKSTHFFLGDGVLCLQAARMLRPLTSREKLASILIACFHIAVACTLAPDVRFFALAIGAAILLPKALFELEADEFGQTQNSVGWRVIVPLAAVASIVFLVTPRFTVGAPIHLGSATGQSGLLSSVLDPSRSGLANSPQVLMQVEGENLGYLKAMALSRFNGETWEVDQRPGLRRLYLASEEELARYEKRRVRVKNVNFLGRVLPTDGWPITVRGKFFNRPAVNSHGVIECESVWNTANNQYEFWIDRGRAEELTTNAIRFYTLAPKSSPRVDGLMGAIARGTTNDLHFAQRLAGYFRREYTYRLGAPALNRETALEDFLFDSKEGHCERFASAMALLLRMKGIPSRVAIGYVPGPKNRFSEWRQVRFSDAHSWTEGWFPGEGWVSFDATPGGPRSADEGFGFRQMMDTLDLIWFANVISFDGPAQRQLAGHIGEGLARLPGFVSNHVWIFGALAVAAIGRLVLKRRSKIAAPFRKAAPQADHYYAKLLRALAHAGYDRPEHLTPLEFLDLLRAKNAPALGEIEKVTLAFCAHHYGETPMPPEESTALGSALRAIQDALKK